MAIVVFGVGVVGLLGVLRLTTEKSADPMIQQQAQLVAEAYLEEILLKKFVDPEDDKVCPAKEATRDLYDNVCDYHGTSDVGAINQLGSAVTGLEAYTVAVTVSPNSTDTTASVNLGSLSNDYVNGYIRVLRVDVTVTGPANTSVTLTGYRTNYNCNATIAVNQCRPLT